jgi:hypothetical protein
MIALLVIVVPIILQNPSDLVYPVAENDLQWGRWNLIQKCRDDFQKFLWLIKCMSNERILDMTEKEEVRRCKIWTVRWTWNRWLSVINYSITFEQWTQQLSMWRCNRRASGFLSLGKMFFGPAVTWHCQ